MPDTLTEWLLFSFYTIGAMGGIVFLAMLGYEIGMGFALNRKRRRAGL